MIGVIEALRGVYDQERYAYPAIGFVDCVGVSLAGL